MAEVACFYSSLNLLYLKGIFNWEPKNSCSSTILRFDSPNPSSLTGFGSSSCLRSSSPTSQMKGFSGYCSSVLLRVCWVKSAYLILSVIVRPLIPDFSIRRMSSSKIGWRFSSSSVTVIRSFSKVFSLTLEPVQLQSVLQQCLHILLPLRQTSSLWMLCQLLLSFSFFSLFPFLLRARRAVRQEDCVNSATSRLSG